MNSTFYLDTWRRFVKEGVLDSSRLSKRILESWYRCKKEKVNPYLSKGLHLLTEEQLATKKAENSLLIEIASPHLKQMEQAIKDSGMMALMVDPNGYVLSLTGNEKALHDARRINFIEGVRWTEGEVGTNAIGTALQTKESVIINGAEHYSVASHQWSCCATPILHENGSMIGVIDVSCPVEFYHPFMLGMVTSIAFSVEKEFSKRSKRKEIAIFQQASNLADSHPNHLFIVCNHQRIIMSASKPIREKMPHAIGMNLEEFLHSRYKVEGEIPFLDEDDRSLNGSCFFLSTVSLHNHNTLLRPLIPAEPLVFKGECGISEIFKETLTKIKLVSPSDTTVFISGETGTGKELIAQAIHDNSPRRNGPFISLNCGAIPKDLMESELFGYVEGAFTGAKRHGYKGKFEQAEKGTIFLDEIGEISQSMQIALLRVLQERKVTPLGSTKEVPVDVRVITATHRNIADLLHDGNFREDLYYRLNVYPINVPPLRKRKEDLPHLIRYVCQMNNWNTPNIADLTERLEDYHWPGNIRELTNLLERLHIMFPAGQSGGEHLNGSFETLMIHYPANAATEEVGIYEKADKKLKARQKIQRDLMVDALKKTKGNVTAAAKLLEIPRSTFYKRLEKYGL